MSGSEFYSLVRAYGGISGENSNINESDFVTPNGVAYNPPENGELDFRRIDVARTIQLLSCCPVSVKTFQATVATLRLPANTSAEESNEAGDGRLFFFTNNGTATLIIQDYLGVELYKIPSNSRVIVAGSEGNSWNFYTPSVKTKSGVVQAIGFSGNPKCATVTFDIPYTNRNYNITITGSDGRSWTYESKTEDGFIINSKANAVLTSEVSWCTSQSQEN